MIKKTFNLIGNSTLQILLLLLAICSVINVIPDVYDSPRTSMLISIPYLIIAVGVYAVITSWRMNIVVKIPDFTILFVVTTLLLSPPANKLWGSGYISLCLLFFLIRIIPTKINYLQAYYTVLIAICLLSVVGYLQYFLIIPSNNPFFSITGSYYNPSIYANVLTLLLSVVFAFLFLYRPYKNFKRPIYISIGICLLSIPLLILSNSRSSWFAIILLLGYLFFRTNKSVWKRFVPTKVICAALLLIITTLFVLYKLKPDSADGRILIWKVSFNMIKDKPLLGYGTDGFAANYMHYQKEYFEKGGSDREKYLANNNYLTYNDPLRIIIEYGLVGFTIYFVLIYLLLFKVKSDKKLFILFKTFIIGYLTLGLFSYPNKAFPILMWLIIMLAGMADCIKEETFTVNINTKAERVFKIALSLILVALFINLVYDHKSYNKFHKILAQQKVIPLTDNLPVFFELQNSLSGDVGFMSVYSHTLYKSGQDSLCLEKISQCKLLFPQNSIYIIEGDCLKRLGRYKEAELAYWYAHYMVPSKQRARGRLAFLYKETGRYQKGKYLAQEILNEDVKVYGFDTYDLHKEIKEAFMD